MIRLTKLREFFSYTEFDGAILTKTDADAKGGSAISISYITSKPIIYLGVGQGYDDIIKFNRERFVETIFNNESLLDSHRGAQTSLPDENHVVPEIEEANAGKDTVNPLTDDVIAEKSRAFDQNFVSEDGPDPEILLAQNRPETLPDFDKESMNDELKIDSLLLSILLLNNKNHLLIKTPQGRLKKFPQLEKSKKKKKRNRVRKKADSDGLRKRNS